MSTSQTPGSTSYQTSSVQIPDTRRIRKKIENQTVEWMTDRRTPRRTDRQADGKADTRKPRSMIGLLTQAQAVCSICLVLLLWEGRTE